MLYRCIYASTLSADITADAAPEVLREIERQSADNNLRKRVSGILLSTDRQFVQILEGSNRSLSGLIQALYGDPRHSHMVLMEFVAVERRVFPEWTMKWAPVKRRPELASPVWDPEKLTAQAILSLAKSVRAGLAPARPSVLRSQDALYLEG